MKIYDNKIELNHGGIGKLKKEQIQKLSKAQAFKKEV